MARLLVAAEFAFVGFLLTGIPLPAAETGPIGPVTVAELIVELDSNKFAAREKALQALAAAGEAAVPELVVAAETQNLEVASRAVDALRRMAFSGPTPAQEAAAVALSRLAEANKARAPGKVAATLAAYKQERQQQAITAIERLAGQVESLETPLGNKIQVILTDSWTGGDEGLAHLKLIQDLEDLRLHDAGVTNAGLAHMKDLRTLKTVQIYGTELTNDGLDLLAQSLPEASIDRRSGGQLGVLGVPGGAQGCLIADILPESAAAAADLKIGDVIQTVDGQAINDFEMLVDVVRRKRAGETLSVEVARTGQTLTKEVVLGRWRR